MANLTRPAVTSGLSAGSFLETTAGNRAYHPGRDGKILNGEIVNNGQIMQNFGG